MDLTGAHGGGILRRNDTGYPAKMTVKLRELYDRYTAARVDAADAEHGWATILKYYQYLVRTVMSDPEYGIGADGNARGVLVYHTMGMGKTRLAVAVAMALWEDRPTVVMLARSLQGNFRETVYEVIDALYTDPDERARKRAEADTQFVFVSMDAYNAANQVEKAAGRVRPRAGLAEGGLDGKFLIIDEAHNFFRAIINSSSENANARRVYDMAQAARNLRIVLLTGTPAAKDPFELVPCFNMLAGKDLLPPQYDVFYRLYVDRKAHTVRNRERLANRIVGLVSHVSPLRPTEPAGADAAPPKRARDDGWFPEERPTVVEHVEMGPEQYRQYLFARDKEEAEGKSGDGFGAPGGLGPVSTPALSLPGSEKKAMRSYFVRSRSLSNFWPGRDAVGLDVDELPDDAFTEHTAPKLALIADRAKRAPGPVLIYSQFVEAGGLRVLARFLRGQGFEPYVPGEAALADTAALAAGRGVAVLGGAAAAALAAGGPRLTYSAVQALNEDIRDMDLGVLTAALTRGAPAGAPAAATWGLALAAAPVHFAWGEFFRPNGDAQRLEARRYAARLSELKNVLNDSKFALGDKTRLPDTLRRAGVADVMPRSRPLADVSRIEPGEPPLFLKNSKVWGQHGVVTVATTAALLAAKATSTFADVAACVAVDAVRDPAMWYDDEAAPDAGFKFHLRTYLCISVESGIVWAYANEGLWRVLTAARPYTEDAWDDPEVHLSGRKRTRANYNWKETAAKYTRRGSAWVTAAEESVRGVMRGVGRAFGGAAAPYPESRNAYQIFGLDITLDAAGRAWLLEVNTRPGFLQYHTDELRGVVSPMIFGWELESVVFPLSLIHI